MPLTCRNIHDRFVTIKNQRFKYGNTDKEGRPAKLCVHCCHKTFTHDAFCKCCKGRYRTGPRNKYMYRHMSEDKKKKYKESKIMSI